MADDAADTSTTPPATEVPAPSDSAADSEVEAQDPSTPATPADAPADAPDDVPADAPEVAASGDLSSLSLAPAAAPDGGDAPSPPPAEPPQPPPPPQPQQPPAVAQQLPLNLPVADLDELEDEDAAALDNEFLSLLPPCVLPRVDKLKDLNDKREEIMDEYRRERAALEAKYDVMMKPLYEERRGVVVGEFDKAIGEGAEDGVVEDVGGQGGEGQDVKGIPQFWACAMGHVDVIAELVTEADVDCLDHLTDITCHDFPDGLGFELRFHFSPHNPFFSNPVLIKRYEVPNLLTEDEPILKSVTGCDIKWKPDQSLTYREVTKKQRKKGGPNAGQIRTLKKRERTESFFHFFTPPHMPALTEVMDEEEADAVEEAFDHDYDVAQAFRGHLIPRAVLWFTGEAMMMDEEVMEEEMMVAEESGGGDGPPPFALDPNGGNNPFPPPAAGNGENPECKQN